MGEFVVVPTLPRCDFCALADGIDRPARYDFLTTMGTAWANGCEEHWRKHARFRNGDGPVLGTGYGQRLVLPHEVVG